MQLDYSSSHSLILVRKGEVGTVIIINLKINSLSSGALYYQQIINVLSSGACPLKSEVWQRWQLGWRPEGEDVPGKVTRCIVITVIIVQCKVQTPLSGFCYV